VLDYSISIIELLFLIGTWSDHGSNASQWWSPRDCDIGDIFELQGST
jgi:hypothetical protein